MAKKRKTEPPTRFIIPQPEVGMMLAWGKQEFELIAVEPYTRLDGNVSAVLTWRARCLDCDQQFEHTTGRNGSFHRRRCVVHRKPGWGKAQKEAP